MAGAPRNQEPTSPSPPRASALLRHRRPTEQFEDGHHVRLRSRERGTYLHADDDGLGVSLRRCRASMNAAWAVHIYEGDGDALYVLLHSAAYGRYLGATDAPLPRGHSGRRVELCDYEPWQEVAIRWQAVRIGPGNDILLLHVAGRLRANGRHLSVDDFNSAGPMMHWVVEQIPAREDTPRLAAPTGLRLPRSLAFLLPWRVIQYEQAGADEPNANVAWASLVFRGRSAGWMPPWTPPTSSCASERVRTGGLPQCSSICPTANAGGDVPPHGSDSSVSSAGEMCAPSDIFLVMPRNGGVPPSWFDMIRRVRLTYWVDATKRWLGHGDPSVVIPMGWTWQSLMGQTLVYQTGGADGLGDGSCVICSCVMCIQAQHRLAFERRHGAGSFPYEISWTSVLQVKSECQRRGVWEPGRGTCPERVLTLIKDRDIGLECRDAPGWHKCYLQFNRYVVIQRETLAAMDAATLMRLYGPVAGSLYAGEGYWRGIWDTEYVYRGEPGKVANHAVVCMGYIFRFPVPADKPELHLQVLDNQRVNGPPRWILYEAFSYFTYIQVEALNRGEMQQTPPHNTFMGILRVIAKIVRYLLRKILFWM